MSRRDEWRELALTGERQRLLEELRGHGGQECSVGIYSSSTWRPLIPFLEGELRLSGLAPALYSFEYEGMAADLAAGTERYESIVLAVDDTDSYGPLYDPLESFGDECRTELLEAMLLRVDRLRERTGQLLVTLPPVPPRRPHGADRCVDGEALGPRVHRFVELFVAALDERPGVEPLDLDRALAPIGEDRGLDPRLWEIGRIRYSPEGFRAIARAIAPRLLLRAGLGIKAVAVDLDSTLWGGVVGEEGFNGIELGDTYPGSCYRSLQRTLLEWKKSGILLAIASKNNPDDALDVLDRHPEMLLRSEDFDHMEIHWQPKPVSIDRILAAFNIGPEAVLFIDDNPRECEAVARAHPRLRVLQLPEEPIDRAAAVAQLPWPLFTSSSDEDRRRGELQQQQAQRQAAGATCQDRDEYLRSLQIEVDIRWDSSADIARVAQLHGKTNQFNVNPLRYSEAEIGGAMNDPRRGVVSLRYRDRFGEAGLVGCAVVTEEAARVDVETFLLSCRVIGLGVEQTLLAAITERCPQREVQMHVEITEKNVPAREFLGTLLGSDPEQSGTLTIDPARCNPPGWIEVHHEPSRKTDSEEPVHAH
ncbi:MAG: HAD-IIIC family phosphatase [Planctomycetota bacterium]